MCLLPDELLARLRCGDVPADLAETLARKQSAAGITCSHGLCPTCAAEFGRR